MDTIVFDFKCPECFENGDIQLVTLEGDIKLVFYGTCEKCQLRITRRYDLLPILVPA